jgi:hypothetical protein
MLLPARHQYNHNSSGPRGTKTLRKNQHQEQKKYMYELAGTRNYM